MANTIQNIYLTKKEKLSCTKCKAPIKKGERFVAENENMLGICFDCSPFKKLAFLPPGDAALTRRSKKHSDLCGVVYGWNQRRKRFDRKGQYVEQIAIIKAKEECEADATVRAEKNKKAAVVREKNDQKYQLEFAKAIRLEYPNCPVKREFEIAKHACEKHSGRVGRTAQAKQFDKKMIDLAVEAHIRHSETNYDDQFGKGKRKKEIRANVKIDIKKVLMKWS